jgi:hypothetical protein
MTAVELLGLAASASLLAGWRLYFTIFAVGLAMRSGWVDLPDQLGALDVLANPWVIGIAAFGALAEFFADKIMWLDSLWDAAHTFIRPVGGALLTLALVDPADPAWQVAAFLLGGGASFVTHSAKAVARVAVNTSPEPFTNILLSLVEDALTVGIALLIFAYPATAAFVAAVLLAAAILLLVALHRLIRTALRWRRRRATG